MQIDVEKPHSWARRLTITVPAEQVADERRQVLKRLTKKVRLPGFRKGHVPAAVVERQYGPSVDQETIERLVSSSYQEALRQKGFDPISKASVENVSYEPGAELRFDVEFEVRPEIELKRLGGFTVLEPSAALADGEVDQVIDRLRQENATWTPVESGSPAAGYRVRVEITPLDVEGEQPEPRPYDVVLGEGEILESIDQAIRTLAVGDEGEFTIALPSAAGEGAAAAGAAAHRIHLRLLSAERPELPAPDDAFAQGLGDFDSMATLRTRIEEDLRTESAREAEREVRRQLMRQVLEANAFEVPPSLVEQYIEGLIQAPEEADPEAVARAKEQARPAAEYGVRRMLVIDQVAELESLRATEQDVETRVQELAARSELNAAEVRRQLVRSGRIQAIASELTERRVFDYLKSLSTIQKDG